MDQETAYELGGGQPHHLLPVARLDAVVLPAEGDRLGIGADQAGVGDRHSVCVTAEIRQHGFRAAEGRLSIDHPCGFVERREPTGKSIGTGQPGEIAEEGQLTPTMQVHQPLEEQAPE